METTNSNAATLFTTNLQLLGFVPEKFNTGVFRKIVFDERMFTHANNNKAFEATSHFLFHKLDATRSATEFAKCWPLSDTDYWRQSREYRTIAYRWLDELRIKQCLPGRITLRKSYFEDCRGEKLYAIMLAFSTFVVQKVLDRRLANKDKQNSSIHAPIRILGTTSVTIARKEQIISNLESEINRMSSTMNQDNHTMRASNEIWAQVARRLTTSKDGSTASRSTLSEHKHYAGIQWTGMHSILSTLKSNLDKLNRENKNLRQASTDKEEQWRSMIQPTAQSAPKMLDTLSAPFPTEEHPVVDDLPPLKLPTYISNETKKHVMQRVDKYLALHYSKKRQRELENEGDKDIAKKLKTTERETPISAVRSIPTTPAKATPPPMTTFQSPRRRSTLSNTPTARTSVTERPLQPPSPSPLRRSMTPRLHAASSPFSYISEKVSPLSSSFPDYCEQVVNQMMEQFQEQRTPDNIGILSPIDNRSVVSGRLSMISQSKSMRATSPHTRKLSVFSRTEGPTPYIKESKGRKADTPESSLWDYYESKGGTNVYQNSPSLRPTRPSPAISRRARTSFVDTEQLASPSGVSPAASSLYAYREAIEEQDNAGPGLLDETEPDMFYTSDFTIQS